MLQMVSYSLAPGCSQQVTRPLGRGSRLCTGKFYNGPKQALQPWLATKASTSVSRPVGELPPHLLMVAAWQMLTQPLFPRKVPALSLHDTALSCKHHPEPEPDSPRLVLQGLLKEGMVNSSNTETQQHSCSHETSQTSAMTASAFTEEAQQDVNTSAALYEAMTSPVDLPPASGLSASQGVPVDPQLAPGMPDPMQNDAAPMAFAAGQEVLPNRDLQLSAPATETWPEDHFAASTLAQDTTARPDSAADPVVLSTFFPQQSGSASSLPKREENIAASPLPQDDSAHLACSADQLNLPTFFPQQPALASNILPEDYPAASTPLQHAAAPQAYTAADVSLPTSSQLSAPASGPLSEGHFSVSAAPASAGSGGQPQQPCRIDYPAAASSSAQDLEHLTNGRPPSDPQPASASTAAWTAGSALSEPSLASHSGDGCGGLGGSSGGAGGSGSNHGGGSGGSGDPSDPDIPEDADVPGSKRSMAVFAAVIAAMLGGYSNLAGAWLRYRQSATLLLALKGVASCRKSWSCKDQTSFLGVPGCFRGLQGILGESSSCSGLPVSPDAQAVSDAAL